MNRLAVVPIFALMALIPWMPEEAAAQDVDVDGLEWQPLFATDLSDASFPSGSWRMQDGILSADDDVEIWTENVFEDFVLELDFMNASGANSGVIIHADTSDWVPNSLEIQIADDHHETWAEAPPTWRAGAVFGHLAPSASTVRPPGEWNHMRITSRNRIIEIQLNGEMIARMEMDQWTSAEHNPDGSEIPYWLSIPVADLPAMGHIGLQGAHGEAPVGFRNLRIARLD